MFSARWAHRALVGVCIFVAVAVGIYAGWEGWFGPYAEERARGIIDPILAQIPHSEFLERLARVLGALGTVMTAAFGVYKGIYYADRNLPERLTQLLARTDQRLLGDRQPLLAAVTENHPRARARESVFYVDPLNRALRSMQFGDYSSAETSLTEAVRQIEAQMAVSSKQHHNFEEQKAAAHILRGSIASARAEFNAQGGKSPDADRELAEKEFTVAIELRPQDLDALELRGRQREVRGNQQGAIEDYEALCAAAARSAAHVRAARGHRLHGLLLEKRATVTALSAARNQLFEGLTMMGAIGSLTEAERLEQGRLQVAYGRVQIARKKLPDAKKHLMAAASNLEKLKTGEASELRSEAERLLKSLQPSAANTAETETQKEMGWLRRLFG